MARNPQPSETVQKPQGGVKPASGLNLRFGRQNFYLMIAGALVIIIGFALMTGGRQEGAEFNPDEIYSFRRITLAPLLVVVGFVIEIIAIMRKPSAEASDPAS